MKVPTSVGKHRSRRQRGLTPGEEHGKEVSNSARVARKRRADSAKKRRKEEGRKLVF